MITLATIVTALCLADLVLNKAYGAPATKGLFAEFKFFANAELMGVLTGIITFTILGFEKSSSLSLVLALFTAVGIMYLEERNSEFLSTHFTKRAIKAETRQFKYLVTWLVFTCKMAISMCSTSQMLALLSMPNLF